MSNPKHASWTQAATADNGAATAAKVAEPGKRHVVTHLSASFSAANIKLLQLKQGSAVKMSFYVHNQLQVELPTPIEFDLGEEVSAVLAASGAGGQIGAVNMSGYTV